MRRRDWRLSLSLLAGLVLNAVPYGLVPRPLPSPTAGPFDNVWIAEFTNAIAGGAPLTVAPDPWFRYVPQSVALWVLSLIRPTDLADAVAVNASYTLLCEIVLVPLALYWFVAGARSRRAGVGAVLALAAVRGVLIPIAAPVTPSIDATVWYFTQHWQYAFGMPWALVALGATVRATRQGSERGSVLGLTARQGYVVVAGVSLGLVGSIQLVHGAIVAYVVAVACLWKRQWRVLVGTALCSIAVALPNLLVVARYPERWVAQGIEKSAAGAGSMATEYLLLLLVLLVGGLVVAASAPRDGDSTRPGSRSTHGAVSVLGVVSGTLVLLFVLADARWYKYHALYFARFAVVCWAGVVLGRQWSLVAPLRSSSTEQ